MLHAHTKWDQPIIIRMCKIEHPPAFSQTQMQLISLQLEDHRGSSATKHHLPHVCSGCHCRSSRSTIDTCQYVHQQCACVISAHACAATHSATATDTRAFLCLCSSSSNHPALICMRRRTFLIIQSLIHSSGRSGGFWTRCHRAPPLKKRHRSCTCGPRPMRVF